MLRPTRCSSSRRSPRRSPRPPSCSSPSRARSEPQVRASTSASTSPINTYLPADLQITNPHDGCAGKQITFRQLLTHTSSIRDYPGMDVPQAPEMGDDPVQGDPALLKGKLSYYLIEDHPEWNHAKNFAADSCPGDGVGKYSNMGATLLGYLVQQISQKPFQDYTNDNILGPLGMTESGWRLAGLDRSHVAVPYKTPDGGRTFQNFCNAAKECQIGEWDYPDGMLRTSVPQLARFLNMFVKNGAYNGTRILGEDTAKAMRCAQVVNCAQPGDDQTQALMYYYDHDMAVDPATGKKIYVLGHDGEDNGASANVYFDPQDETGVILMANGDWTERTNCDPNGENCDETDHSLGLMHKLFAEAKQKW